MDLYVDLTIASLYYIFYLMLRRDKLWAGTKRVFPMRQVFSGVIIPEESAKYKMGREGKIPAVEIESGEKRQDYSSHLLLKGMKHEDKNKE